MYAYRTNRGGGFSRRPAVAAAGCVHSMSFPPPTAPTPGIDCQLLPGRTEPGYWCNAPGGGSADRRFVLMRKETSGLTGTPRQGASFANGVPVYHPQLTDGSGTGW